MDTQNNFFSINKKEDWQRGFMRNLTVDENGWLIPVNTGEGGMGFFVSGSFDTYISRMTWHRLLAEFDAPENCSVKISCFTSDNDSDIFDGDVVRKIDDYLADPAVSDDEKLDYFRRLCGSTYTNVQDVLIREFQGRHLWVKIELATYGDNIPVFKKLRLYFDTRLFTEYLPDIYRREKNGGEFLGRYISIFQSLYLDMENQIDNVARHFDPGFASGEFLAWLSGWVMVEDANMWDEDRLRYLTRNAVEIFKKRGTKAGMMEAVKLYTGEYPFIVENFESAKGLWDSGRVNLMRDLYGDNVYVFTVIVGSDVIATPKAYAELLRIIERSKPANTEANLVVLAPLIYLDRHSYTGVNSYLAQAEPLVLDGRSRLLYNTV